MRFFEAYLRHVVGMAAPTLFIAMLIGLILSTLWLVSLLGLSLIWSALIGGVILIFVIMPFSMALTDKLIEKDII